MLKRTFSTLRGGTGQEDLRRGIKAKVEKGKKAKVSGLCFSLFLSSRRQKDKNGIAFLSKEINALREPSRAVSEVRRMIAAGSLESPLILTSLFKLYSRC